MWMYFLQIAVLFRFPNDNEGYYNFEAQSILLYFECLVKYFWIFNFFWCVSGW